MKQHSPVPYHKYISFVISTLLYFSSISILFGQVYWVPRDPPKGHYRIDASIDHDLLVLDGHVSSVILKYLEDNAVDIVVMGSFGFEGMGLVVFGSVAWIDGGVVWKGSSAGPL